MKAIKLLPLIILLTVPVTAAGQPATGKKARCDMNLASGYNTDSWSMFEDWEEERGHGFWGAYRLSNFLNSNYFNSLKGEGGIERSNVSFEAGFYTRFLGPFSLNADVFVTRYFLKESLGKDPVDHMGVEIFADYITLPPIYGISDWLRPYIGVGYGLSHLKYEEKKGDVSSSLNTSAPMFHAGACVFIRHYMLKVDYKQTFPSSDGRMYHAWNFGIGIGL
jgi:hypothetical protein